MSISVVSRSTYTDQANAAVPIAAFNLVEGNAVVVMANGRSVGDVTGVSDTAGNDYNLIDRFNRPANVNDLTFYLAEDCTAHATNIVTVQFSGSQNFHDSIAFQISGLKSSPVIAMSDGYGLSTTWATGSLAIGSAPEAIAMALIEADGTGINDGGIGSPYIVSNVGLASYFATAYKIVTADTTPTGGVNSGDWSALSVLFAAPGGGGGGGQPTSYYAQQRQYREHVERHWERRGRIFVPTYEFKKAA